MDQPWKKRVGREAPREGLNRSCLDRDHYEDEDIVLYSSDHISFCSELMSSQSTSRNCSSRHQHERQTCRSKKKKHHYSTHHAEHTAALSLFSRNAGVDARCFEVAAATDAVWYLYDDKGYIPGYMHTTGEVQS